MAQNKERRIYDFVADAVTAWIESEGEAFHIGQFLNLKRFGAVNVAKLGEQRDVGSAYRHGHFRAFDIHAGRVISPAVTHASREITSLLQFGIPDLVLSRGDSPLCAIELTSHKPTWNNIYQRFPKLYRPAACHTPSYIFQLHDDNANIQMNAHKSHLVTASNRAAAFTGSACFVYLYTDNETANMHAELVRLVEAYIDRDYAFIDQFNSRLSARNRRYVDTFDLSRFGGRTFEVRGDCVIAHIGVRRNCDAIAGIRCGVNHCNSPLEQQKTRSEIRLGTHLSARNGGKPVKCMWITKGTGGLDPYPGYLLAGKLLLCTADDGTRTKSLYARFDEIPSDFWWWRVAKDRINNVMLTEIADRIFYQDEVV